MRGGAGGSSSSSATSDAVRALFSQVAVLKLNIKDSENMGFNGPRCAIAVKQKQSFLDLAVRQVRPPVAAALLCCCALHS